MTYYRAPIKRLFNISRRIIDPQSLGDQSVFHYSLPAWHESRSGRVERASDLASGKFLLQGGELLVSKLNPEKSVVIRAKAHDIPTICSTELIVLVPHDIGRIMDRYANYLMLSAPVRQLLESSVESVTNSHKRARVERFLASTIRFPGISDQKRIADFLDLETARIDELIEKKERLVELIRPKWEALMHGSRSKASFVRFGFVADRKARIVSRENQKIYNPLGLLNRGRGVFHKEPRLGEELGDSTFFWVRESDLILSGQFAWEGAVALARAEENGCIVSHRYPVYQGKSGVKTSYLFAYFRTEPGQFILSECSRGAAGRNRPLNTDMLEKEKIPIPPSGVQEAVDKLVTLESVIRPTMTRSVNRIREFRSALITAAVTGQIDVDTWRKRGDTERRLDAIEEDVSA